MSSETSARRWVDEWQEDGVPAWLWRGLLDALDEGVVVLGPGGVLLDASARVLEALGVRRADVIGIVVPAEVSDPRQPARRALAGEEFDAETTTERELPEGRAVLRTRTIVAGDAVVQVVHDLTPSLAAARAAQQVTDELGELNRELLRLVGRVAAAREHERAAIAHALRQNVIAELEELRGDVSARSCAAGMALGECIDALNRLELGLASPVLERGLVAAVDELAAATRTPCRVVTAGLEHRVEDEAVLAMVWRNIREALRNVDAHAGATNSVVELTEDGGWLSVVVRDDGGGVVPGALEGAAASGHIGVVTMREAVEAAGGVFSLGVPPAGGCEVRFSVPVGAPKA